MHLESVYTLYDPMIPYFMKYINSFLYFQYAFEWKSGFKHTTLHIKNADSYHNILLHTA